MGCKLGYEEGKRSLAKARCRIKVCCYGVKMLETCAECSEYDDCDTLAAFTKRKGRLGKKYRESLEFIRANGYAEFVRRGKDWKRHYGELSSLR